MKTIISLLLTLPFMACAQTGGTISTSSDDANVVARIGESDVKLSEVRQALNKLDLKAQAALSQDAASLNQVVRVLMVQRLLLSEAKKEKWHDKASVKEQLQQAQDTALAESYLKSVAEPPIGYPTDEETMQAYETLKPQLASPKQWHLAQIYIEAGPEANKQAITNAEAKLDRVKKALAASDADFAAVAGQLSDDKGSSTQGGTLGWMAEATIVPDIRTEAMLLKKGEISKPIRLKDGWHILKCLDTKDAGVAKFEDVSAALKQRMRDERTNANSQAYVAKLLQNHPLSINEIALRQALQRPSK